MMKDVSESLAGRVGIVQILGLSRKEISGREQHQNLLCQNPNT
jgi:predicted AAA+ superfamily ATPase